ncbi:MAG: hypothetical protein V3S47_09840, partial [Acidobacteriota bacterium]
AVMTLTPERPKDVPPGAYYTDDSGTMFYNGGAGVTLSAAQNVESEVTLEERNKEPGKRLPASLVHKKIARRLKLVTTMVGLRDLAREVLSAQLRQDAKAYVDAQRRLNLAYKKFGRDYGSKLKPGRINDRGRLSDLRGDQYTRGIVASLEVPVGKREDKKWTTNPIFDQPMVDLVGEVTHAESVADGIAASLANRGRLDVEYVAALTKRGKDEVRLEALGKGLAYETPAGDLQIADEYLSGDVRAKLVEAEIAAELEPDRFKQNVTALRAVLPEDKMPSQIKVQAGAPWIPKDAMQEFAAFLFPYGQAELRYSHHTGGWKVIWDGRSRTSTQATQTWGIRKRHGLKLLGDMLNMKKTIVTDFDADGNKTVNVTATLAAEIKIEAMAKAFEDWVWTDATRADRLLKAYNEKFNKTAPRKFSGAHYFTVRRKPDGSTERVHTIPGLSPLWQPRSYQAEVIAGNVLGGNRMDNVSIGGGKTLIAVVTAREKIRLGISKKTLILVENATLDQFIGAAHSMYPGYQDKFIGVTSEDLSPAKRRASYARIGFATDAVVIMPHQVFERISMNPTVIEEYFDDRIDELIEEMGRATANAGGDKRDPTVKDIAAQIKKLEALRDKKLKKLEEHADLGQWFEDLGIDNIIYDESQRLKNLAYTSQGLRDVKGLGSPGGNDRTFDFDMKRRQIQELNNGGGIIMMTGTPVSNSLVEAYTIMRYLAPDELARLGINSIDDWMKMYGVVEVDPESIWEAGKYKQISRLRRIKNNDAFQQFWQSFTSIVTADQAREGIEELAKESGGVAKYPTIQEAPDGGKYHTVVSQDFPEYQEFRQSLAARAMAVKARSGPP